MESAGGERRRAIAVSRTAAMAAAESAECRPALSLGDAAPVPERAPGALSPQPPMPNANTTTIASAADPATWWRAGA